MGKAGKALKQVAEMVIQLRDALYQINPAAAEDFVKLYLGRPGQDNDSS